MGVVLASVLPGGPLGAVAVGGESTLDSVVVPELHLCGLSVDGLCSALEAAARAGSPSVPAPRLRWLGGNTRAPHGAGPVACEDLDIHLYDMPLGTALDLVTRACGLVWRQDGDTVTLAATPLDFGPADTCTVELPGYLRRDLDRYTAGRDLSSAVLSRFLLERCGVALPPGSDTRISAFHRRLTVTSDEATVRQFRYALDQLTPRGSLVALDLHALTLGDSTAIQRLYPQVRYCMVDQAAALLAGLMEAPGNRLMGSHRLYLMPGRSRTGSLALASGGKARIVVGTGRETNEAGRGFHLDLAWDWEATDGLEMQGLHTEVDAYDGACLILPLPQVRSPAGAASPVPTHLLLQTRFVRDRHEADAAPAPAPPNGGPAQARAEAPPVRDRLSEPVFCADLDGMALPEAVHRVVGLAAERSGTARPIPVAIVTCRKAPVPAAGAEGPARGVPFTGDDGDPADSLLGDLAVSAGLDFRVEEGAVIVADPRLPLSPMRTRYQRAPREEAEAIWALWQRYPAQHADPETASAKEPALPAIANLADWLAEMGIARTPGSVALYHSPPQRYVYRHDGQNLRGIQGLMAALVDGPCQVRTVVALLAVEDPALAAALGSQTGRTDAVRTLAARLWNESVSPALVLHDVASSGSGPRGESVTVTSLVRGSLGSSRLRLSTRLRPDQYTLDLGVHWDCRFAGPVGEGLVRDLRTTLRAVDLEPMCLPVGRIPVAGGGTAPAVLIVLPVVTAPYTLTVCPLRESGFCAPYLLAPGQAAEPATSDPAAAAVVQAIVPDPDRVLERVTFHDLRPAEVWPALRGLGVAVALKGTPAAEDPAAAIGPAGVTTESRSGFGDAGAGDDDDDDVDDDGPADGSLTRPAASVTACVPAPPEAWPPRLSVDFSRVTVRDAVRAVCEQAGMSWHEAEGCLVVDTDSWRCGTRFYNLLVAGPDADMAVDVDDESARGPDSSALDAFETALVRDFLPLSPPYRATLFVRQRKLILVAPPTGQRRFARFARAVAAEPLESGCLRFCLAGASGDGAGGAWPELVAGFGQDVSARFVVRSGDRTVPLEVSLRGERSPYHGLLQIQCSANRPRWWRLGTGPGCTLYAEPGKPLRVPTGIRMEAGEVVLEVTPWVQDAEGRPADLDPSPDAFPTGPDGTRLRLLRMPRAVLGEIGTVGALPAPESVKAFLADHGVAPGPSDRVAYLPGSEFLLIRGSPAFEAAVVTCCERLHPRPAAGARR